MNETIYNTVNGRFGIGIGFMMLTSGLIFMLLSMGEDSMVLFSISFVMFIVGAIAVVFGAMELDKIDKFLETVDHY